jgi:hypothetical protein
MPPRPKGEVCSPISKASSSAASETSAISSAASSWRGSAVWTPAVLVSSTSSRASSMIATCAARKSLSPKVISSVAVVSFSFTTGTARQASSRASVWRAFR